MAVIKIKYENFFILAGSLSIERKVTAREFIGQITFLSMRLKMSWFTCLFIYLCS